MDGFPSYVKILPISVVGVLTASDFNAFWITDLEQAGRSESQSEDRMPDWLYLFWTNVLK